MVSISTFRMVLSEWRYIATVQIRENARETRRQTALQMHSHDDLVQARIDAVHEGWKMGVKEDRMRALQDVMAGSHGQVDDVTVQEWATEGDRIRTRYLATRA